MNTSHPAVKNGLLAGLIGVVYYFILYLVNKSLIFSPWNFVRVIILVVFMVFSIRHLVKKENRSITFAEALKSSFLVLVIANVIFYIINHFLNAFDGSLARIREVYTLKVVQMFGRFLGEDEFEQMLDMVENSDYTLTLSGTIMSYFWSLIFGFILALIIAGVTNKLGPRSA